MNCKGPDKRGHIVADTLLLTRMFPRLPACATFVADTCPVHKKCFPVCAAEETSWATMCLQQCVLAYQGLKENNASTNNVPDAFHNPVLDSTLVNDYFHVL